MPINENRDSKPAYRRILQGTSLMGYDGVSALMDIIDNSIEAEAKKIQIFLEQDNEIKTKSRLSTIIIADDGIGMDLDEMYDALKLGSPESENCYSENSLSKFGFGLKSAGFSIAKKIVLISRKDENDRWIKSFISFDNIINSDEWNVFEDEEIKEEEQQYLNMFNTKGTVVFLSDMQFIFTDKSKDTFVKQIKNSAGLTFGSLLNKVEIYIDNSKVLEDDPLFWGEASEVIEKYDGKLPCRLTAVEQLIPLGRTVKDGKKVTVSGRMRAVQLPNPHAYTSEEWTNIKKQYRMTSEREGIYIYRNNRLIAEHTTMGFFNKNDTSCMSLRIRIDVNSDADELIALDVKKKRIQFSEFAMTNIGNLVKPVVKKSMAVWQQMKNGNSPLTTEENGRHTRSNKALQDKFNTVTDPSNGNVQEITEKEITEIEKEYSIDERIMRELNNQNVDKITNVSYLEKNMLWEPMYSSELGTYVVLSREHPFYKRIYSKLEPGTDEVVILDAFFLALASAEVNIGAIQKDKSRLFEKLRATVSQNLEYFLDFDFEESEDEDESN